MTRTPEQLLALAWSFKVDEDLFVERRGPEAWVVCTSPRICINTDYRREYEPMPSNRDEDFIARTRFSSLDAALDHADAYLARMKL